MSADDVKIIVEKAKVEVRLKNKVIDSNRFETVFEEAVGGDLEKTL